MVLLNHAAVDVDDLAIDPTSWAGEKRDSLRDVRRCAEAFTFRQPFSAAGQPLERENGCPQQMIDGYCAAP